MVDQSPASSLPPVEPLPDVPVVPLVPDPSPLAVNPALPGVDPYAATPAPYAPPPGYLPPPSPPGAPTGYYQPANPYGYAYATVQPPRGLSIASMILGICGLVVSFLGALGLFPSIAAIITGHIAQKRQPYARGNWIAGLVCGYIGLVVALVWTAFFVVVFIIGINASDSYSNYSD
jgi:hypothetical protein